MITEQFLFALQFRKIEYLELTALNSYEEEVTFKSAAYVLKCDSNQWLTIFLTEEGNLAVIGTHDGPPENREAITFDNPETITDIAMDYFGMKITWVDFFYNRETDKEINSTNLFDTKAISIEGWKGFVRSVAFGYWLSIDLLKDKFKVDFDFDKTFDKITGLSLKEALCKTILFDAKMEPEQVSDIMVWLESPKVTEVLESEKEQLKRMIRVVEESAFLPDDQILPSARTEPTDEAVDDLPF